MHQSTPVLIQSPPCISTGVLKNGQNSFVEFWCGICSGISKKIAQVCWNTTIQLHKLFAFLVDLKTSCEVICTVKYFKACFTAKVGGIRQKIIVPGPMLHPVIESRATFLSATWVPAELHLICERSTADQTASGRTCVYLFGHLEDPL